MKITFDSKVTLILASLSIIGLFFVNASTESGSIFILNGDFQESNPVWYISTLTYIFGHADFEHVIGNLSIILLLGPLVELKFGWQKFSLMIVSTAILTALLHTLLWDNGLIGASGIAFMLIVVTSLLNTRGKDIPITFILVVFLFLGQEIYSSFKNDQISHFAHLFGGAMGAFWGFYRS
ncbi:MAG: rhomboid family intramembrane serine protease [Flavobacteriales bacterium]|nr:rhomboid family intramembrane serine protease [Flavobacteriales bacterium]